MGRRYLAMGACLGVAVVAGVFYVLSLRPNTYDFANAITLHDVSIVSPDEGWAVGDIGGAPNAMLMHLHDGHWTVEPKPDGLDDMASVYSVSMVAADDGWAVADAGFRHDGKPYHPYSVFLRYDGTSWRVTDERAPDPLQHIRMAAPNDGWAVGHNAAIMHYDGAHWLPDVEASRLFPQGASAISAASRSNVWLSTSSGTIAQYDGNTWKAMPTTGLEGTPYIIFGLSMPSATEGWAVGGIGNTSTGVLLRYAGGVWQKVGAYDCYLNGIVMLSAREGWAAGCRGTILHFHDGAWQTVRGGGDTKDEDLSAISMASPGAGWAVGRGGVILRYTGGGWQPDYDVSWSKQARVERR